jgi:hypothetical protein
MTMHSPRLRFYDPGFYLSNVLNEWRRFDWLLHASRDVIGAWLLVVAIPLSLLEAARLLRGGNGLALFSTLAAFLSLALLDSTKARIYASLLVPVVCLGFAEALTPLSLPKKLSTGVRVAAGSALLVWIIADGLDGYRFVAEEGPRVSRYSEVGQRIEASLDPAVPVLGSQRWWWALRNHQYRSLNVQTDIETLGGAYLILDNDTRGDLTRVPPLLKQQVDGLLNSRAAKVASWRDPTYGLIEIFRF